MPGQIAKPSGKVNGKSEIKKVIDNLLAALCAKNIKAMMSHYAAELVAFDVKPPFQTRGAVAWRHTWEACISYFPSSFETEIKDLHIHVSGDLAFAHYLMRIKSDEKDHDAAQTWIRITSGFKKQQSRWKIVHEHGSVPFNPHSMQASFNLNPDS